ncbi:38514_t:CDS:2 [Gigaspora margarita]|uniref:38514_t:CDS:1 n=1 Tax=Gigaspora margarita TaxID=4874 RepID=A0ABN7WIG4_GIGMA|nr:38514_t:CDS:2 [Gigaspora margarita]
MLLSPVPKKKRSRLNNAQRKEICKYHVKNLSAKHHDIADEFKRRYSELNLDRTTVSKILKNKDQYLHIEENTVIQNRYKNRGPKYPSVEKAINIWVSQVSATGLVLTDKLVKSKGCEFGRLLGISENELNEAASAPLEFLPNERIKLQNLLSQYELEDVYNADETGLFYRILPNQTLAKRPDKSRVMVLLAANATGLHKLRPLNNERAWMRSDIWEKWLYYIDSGFHIQNRKILLLVDNAPSHSSPEPPNNTNKTPSVSNVEDDNYQLSAENEDLINDSPEAHAEVHAEDHMEAHAGGLAEGSVEAQEPTPILLADETKNLPRH